jgi:hypothetical protein
MPEIYHSQMMITAEEFHHVLTQDDMIKYFKQKLANEIAHKLVESNRTKFTYTKLHAQNMVRLTAKVEL